MSFGLILGGLGALGAVAGAVPMVQGFGDQMTESLLNKGPTDGKFKTNLLQNLFVDEGALMNTWQNRRLEQNKLNPLVTARMSANISPIEATESLNEYLVRTASDFKQYQIDEEEAANTRATTRLTENPIFKAQQAQQLRLEKRQIRQADFRDKLLLKQMADDANARKDRLATENRIAMNNNNLAFAQLGLQKQEMAARNDRYSQQIADAKETRNLALIGATLDGLGMTLGGLMNRRA